MSEAMELKRETAAPPFFAPVISFLMGSVGSKVMMAATGLGLWLFVTGHLAGNLLAFVGRDAFNAYAAGLKGNPVLLWGARAALLLGFPLHLFFAVRTSQQNSAARPVAYAYPNKTPTSLAAKTMLISGFVVLAFFLYHLGHFTLRLVNVTDALGPNGQFSPFDMLVQGFKNPLIAGFYIAGQVLLAMHLSHGISALFQHLGLWGRRWTPWIQRTGQMVGYGLSAGFISIPLAVLAGVIKS